MFLHLKFRSSYNIETLIITFARQNFNSILTIVNGKKLTVANIHFAKYSAFTCKIEQFLY